MVEYDIDYCGWKRCKQDSTIIFYSVVGLCDKHTEEWFGKKPEFSTPEKAAAFLLKKHCSKAAQEHKNEI